MSLIAKVREGDCTDAKSEKYGAIYLHWTGLAISAAVYPTITVEETHHWQQIWELKKSWELADR